MNSQVWWYVARSSGLVAWTLLAGSVLLGLALSTRAMGKRPTPAWLQDLHRGVGGLAVVFTGLHLAGLVADSYVHFGIVDLLVPFAASWKPGAVAWGVVGLYVLLAVELTSLLRRRISTRWWRRVHLLSFPLYGIATAHLLTAGTDATNPVLLLPVLASLVAVAGLTFVQIFGERGQRRRTRRTAAGARAPRTSRPTAPGRDAAPATAASTARRPSAPRREAQVAEG